MSIEATLARVEQLRRAIAEPAQLVGRTGGAAAPAEAEAASAGSSAPFASQLAQASAAYPAGVAYPGSSGTSGSAAGLTAASYDPEGLAGSLAGAPAGTAGAGLPGIPGVTGSPGVTGVASTPGIPGLTGLAGATAAGPGSRIVAAAESQLGQTEQPPGSNESPAIAAYREAVAGSAPGEPWCAYFASWAARQAGEPLGASGEGLGSVSQIWSWAQSTGRAIANGPGVVPRPGDLIVFGSEHVGIVRSVLPNGSIETIEGNYENKVARNVRSASEASGYVSMG